MITFFDTDTAKVVAVTVLRLNILRVICNNHCLCICLGLKLHKASTKLVVAIPTKFL